MPSSFDIKLTGKTLPGHTPEIVAKGLASLMKISPERAAVLLSGRETTIKRNLDADRVPRYLQTVEGVGAEVRADCIAEPAPPQATAPETTAKAATELALVPIATSGAENPEAPDSMKCPACGAVQPKRNLCRECGADMPRMLAAQEEAKRQPKQESQATSPYAPPTAVVRDALYSASEPVTPPAFGLSFEGRIGRMRYLAYGLPVYVPLMVGAMLGVLFTGNGKSMLPMAIFGGTGVALTLIMAVRVAVLRLHDFNLSGRWLFLPIALGGISALMPMGIVVVAIVVGLGTLALLLVSGSYGNNDFGPPPGPNTALTVVGAIIFLGLGAAGKAAQPDRFVPTTPVPPVEEQSE